MYGVPKFKEGVFLKFKREIVLSVCALLTIVTVAEYTPAMGAGVQQMGSPFSTVWAKDSINSYKVVYNKTEVGVVADAFVVEAAKEKAVSALVATLGYTPDINPSVTLVGVHTSDSKTILEGNALAEELYQAYHSGLGVVKQEAYVMKIGDGFTVALHSEEEIKEVLKGVQSHYITDKEVDITLDKDQHNTLVMSPKISMLDEDRVFATAGAASEPETSNRNKEKTVDVEFSDRIMVVKAFVDPAEIKDVQTATELITQENAEAEVYTVKPGDSASTIASANGMGLSELYELNPVLKQKEKTLQIGDEVVVQVSQPELSVSAAVEITYTQAIPFTTVREKDNSLYVGKSEVRQEGKNGTMEVQALVTRVNGQETGREILRQTVLEEPQERIVVEGSKPVPTQPSGRLMYPTVNFRMTSPYGSRSGGFHTGMDFAAPYGTKIVAADGGRVVFAGWKSGYGYTVDIDHGKGMVTRYAHASSISAKVGQAVKKGQTIARIGSTGNSTGNHVHFEVRINDAPRNPATYLK
ncbi:M23 family metallopeptidase [Anaerotalea alkaliphila]|uniref:Peptidoglycan DD-metalloendopeptidase family protein n=1 Tax=Anaerotalea alkaliphila TaxID=2662126 RepID=A0A7X5HTK0_9FIRM|nr:M23 family metallopeptidase [Anaerotalea alkaliphila]NDL66417.1 peptidoglycan DD-metalloendopeptidase family protein [Anaerotalea alkaliphila]